MNRNQRKPEDTLTKTELQVCVLLATGATDAQIGMELGKAAATIKVHGLRIRDKLGVDSRIQVAIWWLRRTELAEVTALRAELAEVTRQRDNWKGWFSL